VITVVKLKAMSPEQRLTLLENMARLKATKPREVEQAERAFAELAKLKGRARRYRKVRLSRKLIRALKAVSPDVVETMEAGYREHRKVAEAVLAGTTLAIHGWPAQADEVARLVARHGFEPVANAAAQHVWVWPHPWDY
jgi:hypothetical protein